MTWLLMNTGREHYLAGGLESHPDNVPSIAEIAYALAHINRFTGHAKRAYSVAEHSLLVADMMHADGLGPAVELCGLMHDAHECITGDVASPIKQVLGKTWAEFEDRIQAALLAHYELTDPMRAYADVVKHYDLKALATERRELMAYIPGLHAPWPVIDTPGKEIAPLDAAELMEWQRYNRPAAAWADHFIRRYEFLAAPLTPKCRALCTPH